MHDGAYVTHHENVTIEIVPKNKDHVIRGYDELLCPRIDQIKDILIESKEYLERELELQKFFEEVSAASGLKINSIKIAAKLGSNVYCDVTQGFSFPGALTPEQLAELEKIHGYKKFYYPFSNPEAQNLTCSAFFKELLERIDSAFQKKGVKYAYYSGHDTTLAGFLSCLNLVQDKNPPFASNLIFEVDDNHSVTVIYNDEILKIPDCSSKMCPLDEFKRILTSKILNNLDEACLTK